MINKHHYNILSERYLETLLGDICSLFIMIGQAPLIAFFIILKFSSSQSTETLFFITSLSCLWFGCINSCQEIAKEKSILKRESLFGLDLKAYLLSKIKVLSLIGLIEIALFLYLLNRNIDLDVNLSLAFLIFFELYFAGLTMGLFLSEWMQKTTYAVISVPVMMIPQIVFSKFSLPENMSKGIVLKIEKIMFVKWAVKALNSVKTGELEFYIFLKSVAIIFFICLFFVLTTYFHLILNDD